MIRRARARLAARFDRWLYNGLAVAHNDWHTARLAMAATIGTPAARAMERYERRARRRIVVWEAIWSGVYGGER